VPADVIERETRIAEQITRDEGKPEQIIPKIVQGRLNRVFAGEGGVLVEQAFIKEPKKTVQQVLDDNGVIVRGFAHFQVGQA
jgi:elongation factor Ts